MTTLRYQTRTQKVKISLSSLMPTWVLLEDKVMQPHGKHVPIPVSLDCAGGITVPVDLQDNSEVAALN